MAALLVVGVLLVVRLGGDDPAGDSATTTVTGSPATSTTTTLPAEGPDIGTVTYVFDGDTIEVEIGGVTERVRLLGIDTPETKVENAPPECFGLEATAFTRSLLPNGTKVRLERDVVARDDFGRLLAYVFRVPEGLFVNEELLRQGFAQLLVIRPNFAYADRFRETTRAAEAADLGLWGACGG